MYYNTDILILKNSKSGDKIQNNLLSMMSLFMKQFQCDIKLAQKNTVAIFYFLFRLNVIEIFEQYLVLKCLKILNAVVRFSAIYITWEIYA